MVALSPVAGLALAVNHVGHVSTRSFILYAAVLGVTLGLLVTPVVALLAMADGKELVVTADSLAGEPAQV